MLPSNPNDADVMIDSLARSGIISVEIPEMSLIQEVTGEHFVKILLER